MAGTPVPATPPDERGAEDLNLAGALERSVTPGKAAFRIADQELGFGDFDEMASRAAGGLRLLGVRRGDRVAVMAGSHPQFLATIYGAWKLGGIVVAINAQLGAEEVRAQLANSTPSVAVGDAGRCRAVLMDAVEGLTGAGPRIVTTGDLDGPPQSATPLPGDADATIFYTSGTTGTPKGATHTHRALRLQLDMVAEHLSVTRDDEFLSVLPIYLLSILALGPMLALHIGATCRLMERYDAWAFAQHVQRDRTTVIGAAIPMMFADLLELEENKARQVDLSTVRIANCGGSPMPPDIRRAFERRFDFRFVHAYGGTEGPAIVSTDPFNRDRKFDSVGIPLPSINVTIEDEDGNDLPAGQVGEITTRAHTHGPYMSRYEPMRCYWRMPAETEEALRGGRLHWGDMGFLDSEGFLYLVDRKNDMIIRGGQNVYPRELENLLHADPRVAECAVVGVPHQRYGEVPWAYVRAVAGARPSESDLLAVVNDQTAKFKHLQGVSFVEDFPRNALGKVLKRQLRATK